MILTLGFSVICAQNYVFTVSFSCLRISIRHTCTIGRPDTDRDHDTETRNSGVTSTVRQPIRLLSWWVVVRLFYGSREHSHTSLGIQVVSSYKGPSVQDTEAPYTWHDI